LCKTRKLQQFNATGEFLRAWGGWGSGEGQFGGTDYTGPAGVAIMPDGTLTVTDFGNHRIQQFSATGGFLRTWGSYGSNNGQFDEPFGVAVAADGTITVVDSGNYRIQQFSAMGAFLRTWRSRGDGEGEFIFPGGVAVANDGTVTVTDTENHRLQQFSATGVFLREWGTYGSNNGQFDFPVVKSAHENASKRLDGQSTQTPLLDANANAQGNERDDLRLATGHCLGIDVDAAGQLVRGCKGYLSPPPQIEAIAADRDLHGEQSAELWLTVDPLLADSLTDAWILLTRPDTVRDDGQAFDRLPVITLQRATGAPERWEAVYAPGGQNRQGETYAGFDVIGDYTLAYYVKNKDGLLSAPKLGEITQTQGDTVTPPPVSGSNAKLINLSTRGPIQAGDGALVGGFVLQGTQPQSVLIKGLGPSLSAAGLNGVLSDPELTLHRNGSEIAKNDDWENSAQASQIRALSPPADGQEAALLLTLDPGVYTATVSGKNGSTGLGMVEINVVGETAATLVNLSTRGPVQAGDGALIGGFVLQGSESKAVLIRGIGPSLSASGLPGALADPMLTLHAGGVEIARNDDWTNSAQAAQIGQLLPPTNEREPALLVTLAPGAYTASVSGQNGATGIGMVEVYVMQ
jgi:hypothetical protein